MVTRWSELLKGVSIELNLVKKKKIKSSSRKMFVSLKNSKLWKPEFKRERSKFDFLKNGNLFDWQLKHTCEILCFVILQYCELFRLVQILWNLAWQFLHETWCCFDFTFPLQQSQKDFCNRRWIFKWLLKRKTER